MAAPKRVTVTDASGDGPLLALLPETLRQKLRRFAARTTRQKEKRLLRVGRRIYPSLQAIEQAALAEGQRLLADRSFDQCLADSKCIERALNIFDGAWQTGLADLRNGKAAPLAFGNLRTPLGACGMSVGEGQQYFLRQAVAVIFKDNPRAFERLQPFIHEKSSLPRMRLLAGIDALTLGELQTGWGRRFPELLTTKDDDYAAAIRRLKPFQVRAMRQVMEMQFMDVLDWPAEMVDAVGESFQCVEQFRDLGPFFVLLDNPEVVRAVGRWEKRDITDKINADRMKSKKKPLKGRRYETDIAIMKRLLGTQMETLLTRQPGVIDAFGEILAGTIRPIADNNERNLAIEQMQILAKRYLQYLTADVMEALMHPDPGGETLSLKEMVGILEGLWMKNGLGTAFFEGPFQSPEGAAAVREIALAYIDMKRRGSAKRDTDVAALITGSDLFDRHIVPFLRRSKPAPASSAH